MPDPVLDSLKRELAALLVKDSGAREVVVFPPSIGWRLPFLFQRPQQMALALARQGCLVFFCEPAYANRYPDGFTRIENGLFIANVPLEVFAELDAPVVMVVSYSGQHLSAFRRPRVVYDHLDSVELEEIRAEFPRAHRFLLARATVVLVTSSRLLERVLPDRPDALLSINAVDFDHFHRATAEPRPTAPADLQPLLTGSSAILGYIGVLSREWIDYDLLRAVATSGERPTLVLIGIDYDGSLHESGILELQNVRWLGPRPYSGLPDYLAWFDVALIPFVVSEVTSCSSPVKLLEYLAAGRPVVSSDIPESRKFDPVLVASTPDEFVASIAQARGLRDDPSWRAAAEQSARSNTWGDRASALLAALDAAAKDKNELERLRAQVEQLGAVAMDGEKLVRERTREAAALQTRLESREHQIKRRDQMAMNLQSALRREIATRHDTVPKLHGQILEQKRLLDAQQAELDALRRSLAGILRSSIGPLVKLQQATKRARTEAVSAVRRQIGQHVPYEVRTRLRKLVGLQPRPRPMSFGAPLAPVNPLQATDAAAPALHDVVCFPIIDWRFRFQRPQQLMLRLARAGHRVFYVNPQSLLEGEFLAGDGPEPRVARIDDNLFDVRLPACSELNLYQDILDPVNGEAMYASLAGMARRFGIVSAVACVQLPFWTELALRTKVLGWKVVYDCMDEHGGFSSNSSEMVALEELLFAASDHVVVSSRFLLDKVRGRVRAASLIPNACDLEHFSPAAGSLPPPGDVADLRHPIVGYYGAISEWFDFDLIRQAVEAHPDWSFLLIGSTWGAAAHDDLAMHRNVRFVGEKPYAELPSYLSQFDVATIPFALSPLIQATSPVKFYEYLAAGKPVVASELPELAPYRDLAWLTRSPQEFVRALEEALGRTSADDVGRRRAFAAEHTWEVRTVDFERAMLESFGLASVIVVTWNNLDFTRQCVESLLADRTWPNLELIFVDNGSTDGTVEYLKDLSRRVPRVTLVLNEENRGFAAANNQGIEAARGRYIVLLNNDTVVTRGWLARLIRHLEEDPRIGLIGPVTNNVWNEARQEAGYTDLAGLGDFAEQWAWEHAGRLYPIKVLAMYCVAARREVVEQVGRLDESFGIGMFEDDDYAHRVRALGYRVVCAEEVYIHHAGRASFARLPEQTYLDLHEENRRKFEEKWAVDWKPHTADRQPALYWRERIDALLAEHPERAGVVVFLPTIGWSIDLFQRPHQLALAFARMGYLVLFCLHEYDAPAGPSLEKVAPNLYLSSVPFESFESLRGALVMVMPYNAWFAAYFPEARLIYDVVDELAVFPGDQAALQRQHESLLRSADVVLATADRLLESVRQVRRDAVLNPNAADFDHFANGVGVASDLAALGGSVIGYFGALARWFDYELVRHAALARPGLHFVLIGPDHDGTLARSRLAGLRNVHALGPRPYRELPGYLRGFDVAMIPFTVDEITRSVSPIKLFEFMAAGKPIVSSDLPECRKVPAVLIAESRDVFVRQIDAALARKDDPALIAELKRVAGENTWAERARGIVAAVETSSE